MSRDSRVFFKRRPERKSCAPNKQYLSQRKPPGLLRLLSTIAAHRRSATYRNQSRALAFYLHRGGIKSREKGVRKHRRIITVSCLVCACIYIRAPGSFFQARLFLMRVGQWREKLDPRRKLLLLLLAFEYKLQNGFFFFVREAQFQDTFEIPLRRALYICIRLDENVFSSCIVVT